MSTLVILAASVFFEITWKKNRQTNRKTAVKTEPLQPPLAWLDTLLHFEFFYNSASHTTVIHTHIKCKYIRLLTIYVSYTDFPVKKQLWA